MAETGSQRDADDSVDRLITEAASLYGYANLKDEQKKVLKSFVEGKEVFVAPFNSLACFFVDRYSALRDLCLFKRQTDSYAVVDNVNINWGLKSPMLVWRH